MFSKIKIRLLVFLIFILAVSAAFIAFLHNKEKVFLDSIRNEGNQSFQLAILNQLSKVSDQRIDDYTLNEIASNTGSTIKLILPEEQTRIEKSFQKNLYINYTFVNLKNGVNGDNKIIFGQKESSRLTQIKKATDNEQIYLLIGFVVFGFIIFFVLFIQVVNPISIIITSVVSKKPERLNKLLNSKNEFGVFANLIREFFYQKKTLEEEINVRKITQEELETLNDELEKRVTDRTEELAVTNLELQKERDQTKQYLDIAGTIIAILDCDGYILLMNKKGDEVLGYQPGELLGKNWYETCIHPKDRSKFIKTHNELVLGKDISEDFTIGDVVTKGLEVRTLIFHKTFMNEGDSKNSSLLFSAEDITELKLKEKELIDAKDKADESNKLKSMFLANMSHELRTPMIGILGFSDLLINELSDVKLNKMAVAIHDSGQRLIDTLNLILDLSRLEANKHNINYQIVNLNSLVKNVTFDFEAAAGKKKLFLKTTVPSYDVLVRTDPRMIRDVINNLINNAIKFTNSGGVFISLEVFHKSFIISIKDTGIGIPQNSLNIIFEEFRQVSEGLGRGFQGTGLGLTICKKYVELLSGEISVISKQDEGSKFTFKIPMFSEEESAIVENNSDKDTVNNNIEFQPSEQNRIMLEKNKLLIVEDDETSREIIFLFLKDYYELSFAETGEQAIEIARKQKFDCILMDINLGAGLTGIETKDAIRMIAGYENIPIIAATAFAMLGDKEKFLTGGFIHYISKPFLKNQLLRLLDSMFKSKN